MDILINQLAHFLSELDFGWFVLTEWQLSTIALVVLLIVLLVLRHQRKHKDSKTPRRIERPDIIGTNLSKNTDSLDTLTDVKASISETEKTQKSWRHTTHHWIDLKEQIRKLQREVKKLKLSETHLNFQLIELKDTNTQLKNQVNKLEQELERRQQQVSILTQAIENQQKTAEHKDLTAEDSDKHQRVTVNLEEKQVKKSAANIQSVAEEKPLPYEHIINNKTKQEIDEAALVRNQALETTTKQEEDDTRPNDVPLNVQELEHIAALAKRLRGNNRNEQGSQL